MKTIRELIEAIRELAAAIRALKDKPATQGGGGPGEE